MLTERLLQRPDPLTAEDMTWLMLPYQGRARAQARASPGPCFHPSGSGCDQPVELLGCRW